MRWYFSSHDIARIKPIAWAQYIRGVKEGGGTHGQTPAEFEHNGMARWSRGYGAELMVAKCFGLKWNSELYAGQFKRRDDGTEWPDAGVFTQVRAVEPDEVRDRRLIVHAPPGWDVTSDGDYIAVPQKKDGEAGYDRYILVLVVWPEYVIFRGWAGGSEVQKKEYAPGPNPRRPAFYLPNRLLRPMETFEDQKWES